jgi:hypothetical protein
MVRKRSEEITLSESPLNKNKAFGRYRWIFPIYRETAFNCERSNFSPAKPLFTNFTSFEETIAVDGTVFMLSFLTILSSLNALKEIKLKSL